MSETQGAAACLPEGFRRAWAQARESVFLSWWREALTRALEDPATASALPRAVTRRVLGREDEAIAEAVLPHLDAARRERLLAELAAADPVEATVMGCVVDLVASHRPFLIADELLKRHSARIERNLLEEVLGGLQPASFFRAHLGAPAVRRLEQAWPGARPREADEPLGTAELREIAQGVDEGALGEPERGAFAAWRSLVDEPTAFDYGCGLGALASVLAEHFETSGGDIYSALPTGELQRAVAWLRATRRVDAPPEPRGGRVVDLDPVPGPGSPPEDGAFSAVTCNGVMEHVTDPEAFEAVARKLVRLLRPGGVLVLNASPTLLGYDGHHALHPAWGVLLHRLPGVRARPRFEGRWREGFTHRVSRRRLQRALGPDALPPEVLWPQLATVRARFGALAPAAFPVLRRLGGTELAPTHAWLVRRRLAPFPGRAQASRPKPAGGGASSSTGRPARRKRSR